MCDNKTIKCDLKDIEDNVQQCTEFWFFMSSLLGEKGTSKHKDIKSFPQNQPYTLLPKATFAVQNRSHLYEQIPMSSLNFMFFQLLECLSSFIGVLSVSYFWKWNLSIGLKIKIS